MKPEGAKRSDLARFSDARIQAGSKSFSLASRLFPEELRVASHMLYAWCRFCDDAIDEAPSQAAAKAELAKLRALTAEALDQTKSFECEIPEFQALREVAERFKIPKEYPEQLLLGMEMDVVQTSYATLGELELYCFRVASVVGLMMTHIMTASSRKALLPALQAGLAMQMTNIARDVKDDFKLGRVYLPAEWLQNKTLAPAAQNMDFALYFEAARRLLAAADERYASARQGLRYLPLRAAIAVSAALEIYRDIGRIVLARGPSNVSKAEHDPWRERAYLSKARKVWLALKGAGRVLLTAPARAFRRHAPAELNPALDWPSALGREAVYEQPMELPQFIHR